MTDYQRLTDGPPQKPNEDSLLNKKYLCITMKEYYQLLIEVSIISYNILQQYLIFTSSLIAITVLNLIFRDYLFNVSVDFILSVQNSGRNTYLTEFYMIIKKLGSPYFIFGSLLLIYIFESKALAFHYTMIISVMMFFVVFMKLLIRFPRPYQYHPDIIPTSCSGQFGCPSSTSIRVSTMVLSLFLDFIYTRRKKMKKQLYILGCVMTFIGIVGVMSSRVYLAAHSLNQVIFGSIIGLEIALFMHYCVKPQTQIVFNNLQLINLIKCFKFLNIYKLYHPQVHREQTICLQQQNLLLFLDQLKQALQFYTSMYLRLQYHKLILIICILNAPSIHILKFLMMLLFLILGEVFQLMDLILEYQYNTGILHQILQTKHKFGKELQDLFLLTLNNCFIQNVLYDLKQIIDLKILFNLTQQYISFYGNQNLLIGVNLYSQFIQIKV